MSKEKRNLRKEMKCLKERMTEIEMDIVNQCEDTDPEYIKSIEDEYNQLTGDYAELEELKKSKSSWKKYVFSILAIITAIASIVTVLWKFKGKFKKKK